MFNMMKTISITTLTGLALTGAMSAPSFANHQDGKIHNHKSNENTDALAAGALGALIGGVVGSEVAGSGNGTEGAIVGALVGGLTGAAIADDRRDQRFDGRRFDRRSNRQYRSDYYDYDYDYDYDYRRTRRHSYRRHSFDRYSHDRFGSRSSIHKQGRINSRRGHSFRKFKKLKKHH